MRVLIDLPDADISWLDSVARAEGKSRAAVLRDAVVAFRRRAEKSDMEQYFGLWERHGSTVDGLEYEERLRNEWPSIGESRSARKPDAA